MRKLVAKERKYVELSNRANMRQKLARSIIKGMRLLQGINVEQIKIKYDSAARIAVAKNIWRVLYVQEDLHWAQLVSSALSEVGIEYVCCCEEQTDYPGGLYVVICPQKFQKLPKLYLILQTEDYSKWQLDPIYHKQLVAAPAILECSSRNVEFLSSKGLAYNSIFLMNVEQFNCYFARMLFALGFIDVEKIFAVFDAYNLHQVVLNGDVCLSLPETVGRREHFVKQQTEFKFFDGIRYFRAWQGCALSYQYLCMSAIKHHMKYLTICEDDVVLQPNFMDWYRLVQLFLIEELGDDKWAVFCAVIAVLHEDTKVIDVVDFRGVRFVVLDQTVSSVFNIYNTSALRKMAKWDFANEDVESNTIDKYFGSVDGECYAVTTLPFGVRHNDCCGTTIWGVAEYCDRIADSEALLRKKVDAFLAAGREAAAQ